MSNTFDYETEKPAVVGILIDSKVIYNIVEFDTEFSQTGRSIINFLKHNNNLFVSKIFESQSYNGIKHIFDDSMIFGDFDSSSTRNTDSYDSFNKLIYTNSYDTYYIYDYNNDILLLKVKDSDLFALDYKSNQDVREFIRLTETKI